MYTKQTWLSLEEGPDPVGLLCFEYNSGALKEQLLVES